MNFKQLRNIGQTEVSKAWLKSIETIVDSILEEKTSLQRGMKLVEGYISKMIKGYEFDIAIINAKKPFIMCIYPDMTELEYKCSKLSSILNDNKKSLFELLETWSTINIWHIEVDANLFSNQRYRLASGREFVAILMHEIGHVAYTNHAHLISNYRRDKAKFKRVEKLIMSDSIIVQKVYLPMLIHTLNFRVITQGHINNNMEEIKADLNVPDEYKADLIIYLDRCILHDPTTMNTLITTESELDQDQKIAVEFTKQTISLVTKRRDLLVKHVDAQYKYTESPYVKQFLKRFANIFTGKNLDTGKVDVIREATIMADFASEYALYEMRAEQSLMESSKITDRDLSILQVEGDTIESADDKIYVLHTIYDYMENVEHELIKKNKTLTVEEINKDKRIMYLKTLRDDVMKKKIIDKHYGVFIKYPAGYEG